MVKVGDRMSFDDELDLKSWLLEGGDEQLMHGGGRESRYVLHSVMVHSGDANSGHYYAFVRPGLGTLGSCHAVDDGPTAGRSISWFRFDDARVVKVSRRVVELEGFGGMHNGGTTSTSAYLLQYVRRDSIPALLHHHDEASTHQEWNSKQG